MTAVLRSPPHLPSSPSSPLPCNPSDGDRTLLSHHEEELDLEQEREREEEQLSLLALLLTLVRKSLALGCRTGREDGIRSMEIGWPTEVRHVAHVTFDRFHGFLGLPVEFEPEVPRRAPSASASVFGVSTESMQCSYDPRGNSIPTILLLMQWRLYAQGGLQAEGIFRINAENSQEEHVRDQLNSGIVPDGIDVHCLAGLIKAWFRELPTGVLDSLAPEQVMQCESEDECAQLVKLLPPTEAALLDWAINLMADVVQEEHHNKMNARNVAMVFAPNMTQMADPLTALMYAVQVMNFLKMLILRTLKGRQELVSGAASASHSGPSDENGHYSPKLQLEPCREEPTEQTFVCEEPISASPTHQPEETATTDDAADGFQTCRGTDHPVNGPKAVVQVKFRRNKTSQPIDANAKKALRRGNGVRSTVPAEKSAGISIVSRINSRSERVEAWR